VPGTVVDGSGGIVLKVPPDKVVYHLRVPAPLANNVEAG
jgi:hypothetical protein